MKHKILELIAFLLFMSGIAAICFLIGARAGKVINPASFLIWMGVTGVVMGLDAMWICRNFVGGEWI
ncbi:MAG: hypothetical protein K0R34_4093 [Herbinix sp.]|jgi:hypothetical protein|nr:hypothetical protein [Herbinix sp.]